MSNSVVLDTNLIVRFLTNDDEQKSLKVENLLKDNTQTNILPDVAIAEVVWVLTSFYEKDKTWLIEKIRSLIQVESVKCNKDIINLTLDHWENYSISFVDAYLAAVAERENIPLCSYDQKLDRISSIVRKEP